MNDSRSPAQQRGFEKDRYPRMIVAVIVITLVLAMVIAAVLAYDFARRQVEQVPPPPAKTELPQWLKDLKEKSAPMPSEPRTVPSPTPSDTL